MKLTSTINRGAIDGSQLAGPDLEQPATPGRGHPQGGFSLIEILVCIVLAGTVILALAYGMLTLMRVNKSTSEREQIQLAIGNFTERLVVSKYIPCAASPAPQPTASAYNALPKKWVPTQPGMTAKVTNVEFWDDAAKKFVSTCPTATDQQAQRLNVEVTWRGRAGTGQIVTTQRPDPTP